MPEPSARARRRTRRNRRLVVGGVATVIVLAAGTTAWAVAGGSGTSYRTATVGRGSVEQLLTTTGTLSPLHSADVDFQVAGTVKKITAHQGQHVRAGATLATVDRTSLAATLAAARSTLSAAEVTLADDESGGSTTTETPAATTGVATVTATDSAFVVAAATPSPSPSLSPSPGSSGSATISRDQAAVVAAQHTTDLDLATAKQALATTKTACATPGSSDCTSAAATLLADQTAVSNDEKSVLSAEQTLDTDSEKLLVSGHGTTASPTPRASRSGSTQSGSTHSRTAQSGSGGSAGASTRTVTAATLASDEASIDTDRATLASDRSDLAEATLTSPITGTVMAVTISTGDAVSGSSSSTSPAFIVRVAGHDEVTLSLSPTQVRTVTKGMTATARPDGSSTTIAGHVIAVSPADSDSGYPVVVELDGSSAHLVNGADAAVSLLLGSASDVVTVPTSAVHRSGSTTYVELLNGGKEVRRTVVTGATGAALTQIRSGLSTGQRVVLADLDAAVPSSSNTLTRSGFGSRFGGTGGFGGGPGTGGFGGAGAFPGARSGTTGN
jgi:multidrug efflux pump subunit AcrA (membrane-fusion protein)